MSGLRPFAIQVIALVLASACAHPIVRTPAAAIPGQLQVVGSYILAATAAGDPSEVIAGLSGAWYDDASRQLFVVSDRGARPALLTMGVTVAPDVRLVPQGFNRVERAVAQRTLDLEGIAPAPGGHLFLASEGEDANPDAAAPGIYEYTRDGTFVRRLPLPSAYAGLRRNLGFEGLSTSPDGRRLFAATESSLRQDGPQSTLDAGAVTRILVQEIGSRAMPREYAYRTEPVPRLTANDPVKADNGISELLALSGEDLLVMERAYVEEAGPGGAAANVIRLYHVRLEPDADITGRWSLEHEPPRAVLTKHLVLDLGTVASQLVPRLRMLENFEALTFGPRLPDGRRTLLLISDNNDSDRQVTALVVLAFADSRQPRGRK